VASPHANAGLLRVRTTKDFKPVRYYGRLYEDPQVGVRSGRAYSVKPGLLEVASLCICRYQGAAVCYR
jgi:hypothetical protein